MSVAGPKGVSNSCTGDGAGPCTEMEAAPAPPTAPCPISSATTAAPQKPGVGSRLLTVLFQTSAHDVPFSPSLHDPDTTEETFTSTGILL